MTDSEFKEFYQKRGIRLSREPGIAVASQIMDDDHFNTLGSVHGGIISSLMDTCGCYALKTEPDTNPVTLNIQISFINPMRIPGQQIKAIAKIIKIGRNLGHCRIEAFSDGETIAIGNLQAMMIKEN